jgi:hypothetical protein
MSNYPDGMTSRDWAYLDGGDHHEDCLQYENFTEDCNCDTLYPSKEDIELEKLGL